MATAITSVEVTEEVTQLTVTNPDNLSVDITEEVTQVSVNNLALPTVTVAGSNVATTAHGTVTATDVQTAIEQLADQIFKSDSAPSGIYLQQGDFWYDTDDDILKVYLEVSAGTFEWRPVIISNDDDNSILDGGLY